MSFPTDKQSMKPALVLLLNLRGWKHVVEWIGPAFLYCSCTSAAAGSQRPGPPRLEDLDLDGPSLRSVVTDLLRRSPLQQKNQNCLVVTALEFRCRSFYS